jgi:hypothetical protein
VTKRDPHEVYVFRFEGGPHDGAVQSTPITSPDDLPPLIEVDPSGARYELKAFSRVRPHRGLIRGALYRYVGT